ncbi:MAG: hypothetical protein HXY45_11305 [Syntrophaceae bacterium]|nr:hypothetical protein [Syntrophaceae bacterium]
MFGKNAGQDRKREKQARDLLRGAVDFHIHSAPDVYPRILDDIEIARRAKRAGMAGVVLKSHLTITADRAQIAGRMVGLPVFGGVALNWQVGGLNPWAVECAAKLGACQVWMPTIHAANSLKHLNRLPVFAKSMPMGVKGISIFRKDGGCVPELEPVLAGIAEQGMILGTGHLSPEEGLALIAEAKKAGIKKIVVTHPMARFVRYSLEQMRDALSRGASYLEFVLNDCSPRVGEPIPLEEFAAAIRAIGPARIILATDSGQVDNPPPVQMMAEYVGRLLELGLPARAIRTMTATNPARILDL